VDRPGHRDHHRLRDHPRRCLDPVLRQYAAGDRLPCVRHPALCSRRSRQGPRSVVIPLATRRRSSLRERRYLFPAFQERRGFFSKFSTTH